MYDLLGKLNGNHAVKYESVSIVMAEAMRLKRADIYKLLNEYRAHIGVIPVAERVNGVDKSMRLLNGTK